MKYTLWQVLCLVCYSGIACAQTLRPEELISMRKAQARQIDSTMKSKGFAQGSTIQDSTGTAVTYMYQGIENEIRVQRFLLVGWRYHSDYVEVEYYVWQQKEALDWINQLLKAGFKKTVPASQDTRGKNPSILSLFRKNNNSICYQEQMGGNSGRICYKFSITTRGYKGDAL